MRRVMLSIATALAISSAHAAEDTCLMFAARNIAKGGGNFYIYRSFSKEKVDLIKGDALEYDVEMATSLDDLCKRSDYISVHVYLNPETRYLVGREHFAVMKPSAYLINCARGGVVDEAALIDALQRKQLAGAGLDVFEKEPVDPANPLLKMDNVSLTNHYASYSEVAWERAQTQLGEEAMRIAKGMWPMSLINPDVRHVVPPRTPARSWEVYAREVSATRHR